MYYFIFNYYLTVIFNCFNKLLLYVLFLSCSYYIIYLLLLYYLFTYVVTVILSILFIITFLILFTLM